MLLNRGLRNCLSVGASYFAATWLALICPAVVQAAGDAPSLLLVVRHAERASNPADDPPLTEAGIQRAEALAATLANAGVSVIITTQFKRTQETAKPLAKALGLTPEIVPLSSAALDAHLKLLEAAVRRHPGKVVLVVGHERSAPRLVNAIGGFGLGDICPQHYANLYSLSIIGQKAHLVHSRYGAADNVNGPGCP